MKRPSRLQNKMSSNLRMKASSLYFLNDISNIDSSDFKCVTENWRDEYNFSATTIGRGHFSKVFKVKCCSSGSTYAIKVIRRRRIGVDKIDEIMQEIEIMKLSNKSSNSGFIQLLKVHTNPTEVAIVMEFASGGALFHVTQESRDGLTDIYVRIVLTKVLTALSFLHHQDIVHLDIKADNILLRYPYPSTDVAITDFGLARQLTKSKVLKEMIGTPDYIAPEVVNYEEICLNSDMWSIGVLTYFLLTNVSPFTGQSKEDTLHRVTKASFEFVGKLTEEDHMQSARKFISCLLVKEPQSRLSSHDCLSHEFLANIPIVECTAERPTSTDVPIVNTDYHVYVRQNPCHLRGMAMSQYDIDSSRNKANLTESQDDMLRSISFEDISKINASELVENPRLSKNLECSVENIPKAMETSVCSINNIDLDEKSAVVNSVMDVYEESTKVENINTMFESRNQFNENSYNESNDHSEEINSCFTEQLDSSFNEMITSGHEFTGSDSKFTDNTTDISTSDSNSILINDKSSKENYHPPIHTIDQDINLTVNNFKNISLCDSKRPCNALGRSKSNFTKTPMINASFRNSRENIIEEFSNNRCHKSLDPWPLKSCNTVDDCEEKTATLRSGNDFGKCRPSLLKSIKKDVDKPNWSTDKTNRQSELVLSAKTISSSGDGTLDYVKCSISASHPNLTTQDTLNNSKRSTLRMTNYFKNKIISKESKESKWNCIIS